MSREYSPRWRPGSEMDPLTTRPHHNRPHIQGESRGPKIRLTLISMEHEATSGSIFQKVEGLQLGRRKEERLSSKSPLMVHRNWRKLWGCVREAWSWQETSLWVCGPLSSLCGSAAGSCSTNPSPARHLEWRRRSYTSPCLAHL